MTTTCTAPARAHAHDLPGSNGAAGRPSRSRSARVAAPPDGAPAEPAEPAQLPEALLKHLEQQQSALNGIFELFGLLAEASDEHRGIAALGQRVVGEVHEAIDCVTVDRVCREGVLAGRQGDES